MYFLCLIIANIDLKSKITTRGLTNIQQTSLCHSVEHPLSVVPVDHQARLYVALNAPR